MSLTIFVIQYSSVFVILLYNFEVKINFLEFQNLERRLIFLGAPEPPKS